jgi:hypothetical protein
MTSKLAAYPSVCSPLPIKVLNQTHLFLFYRFLILHNLSLIYVNKQIVVLESGELEIATPGLELLSGL